MLERVNSGVDGFSYTYLVARLYNAGFKRSRLTEAFGHSLNTIRRWGEAVKSGDADPELEPVFSETAESWPRPFGEASEGGSQPSDFGSEGCESRPDSSVVADDIRKHSISSFDFPAPPPDRFHVNHLGLSLFLPILMDLKFDERLWNPWTTSIPLGAVNIEQSGELDFEALEFLLAQPTLVGTANQKGRGGKRGRRPDLG